MTWLMRGVVACAALCRTVWLSSSSYLGPARQALGRQSRSMVGLPMCGLLRESRRRQCLWIVAWCALR